MATATGLREKFDAALEQIVKEGYTVSEIEMSLLAYRIFGQWNDTVPLHIQRHWKGVKIVIAYVAVGLRTPQFQRIVGSL